MIFVINGLSHFTVQDSFQELEANAVISDVELMASFLQLSIDQLDSNVYDYASWDDTYEFAETLYPEYIASNFGSSTFAALDINFIIIMNNSGQILYSQGYDLENEEYVSLPLEHLEIISTDEVLNNHEKSDDFVSGLVSFGGVPSIISSRPILKTNNEGPIQGSLIMGSFIDSSSFCSICEISQKTMEFIYFNDPQLPGNIWSPSGNDVPLTKVLDSDIIEGFYPVRDVHGLPIVVVKTSVERSISHQGNEAESFFVFSIISTGIIFGSLLLIFLDRSVLNRLFNLNINVKDLGTRSDLSARLDVEGNDEISNLSNSINNMLDKIGDSYKDVMLYKNRGNALLEALPDLVFNLNEDGTIIHRNNPNAVCFLHLDHLDVSNIFDLLPEDAARITRKKLVEVINSGKLGSIEYNFDIDGTMFNLESRLLAYGDKGDVLAIFSDNSGAKAVENALIETKIVAEDANRVKSEFIGNMSHELRTPLNSVIGFSEILLESTFGDINKKQEKYIMNIRESGVHLLNIVNDILDISKIEAGMMDMTYENVSIHEVMNNVGTMISPLAKKKNVTISQNIDQSLVKIIADKGKVIQMLYNLTGNAVKFTQEGGSIDIGSKVAGEYLDIFVQDTGIGISEENLDKLFDPFVQLDSFISKNHKGTGLGLALVKKFAELHGGYVQVESEVGKGSTFTFSLPLKNDDLTRSD
ncbi:hypothetical protein HNV12_06355 [Methanococcoides sp. SA1]|nr:hypothetical protein [Methanococcoides sp. SA1]